MSDAGARALVARGVGAALMPQLAVDERDPRIAVLPLDGMLPPRRIAVYWHRDRRRRDAVAELVDALVGTAGARAEAPAA